MKKRIFLISPVRDVSETEKKLMEIYVAKLENDGHKVHWPLRDTDQNDIVGLRICEDNRAMLIVADEVHIWWNERSQGSVFDFGMLFALKRKLYIANPKMLKRTFGKSFANVVAAYAENGKEVK